MMGSDTIIVELMLKSMLWLCDTADVQPVLPWHDWAYALLPGTRMSQPRLIWTNLYRYWLLFV